MSFKFNRGCWVESREDSLLIDRRKPEENGAGPQAVSSPASIEERIDLAASLFDHWGTRLLEHLRVQALLDRLARDIETSHRAMIDLAVVAACTRCDATAPEGSCCSRGLEKKYDSVLLLMNRLLGVAIEQPGSRADSCRFLGPTGCRLKVRHMLCIDYLCPQLEKELGPEKLVAMQMATAGEIETGFLLGEEIKKIIMG